MSWKSKTFECENRNEVIKTFARWFVGTGLTLLHFLPRFKLKQSAMKARQQFEKSSFTKYCCSTMFNKCFIYRIVAIFNYY